MPGNTKNAVLVDAGSASGASEHHLADGGCSLGQCDTLHIMQSPDSLGIFDCECKKLPLLKQEGGEGDVRFSRRTRLVN